MPLVCRIELNKLDGITITVENEDGKITQTMVLDGTKITTTVKGDDETSTIIQAQDSIAMECKTFTLKAETITCESEKATAFTSGDTFDIESTKDTTITSSAKITAEATSDCAITGSKVTVTGSSGDVILDGMNVKGTAKTNVEFKGTAGIKLEGTGTADLKGANLTIEGQAMTAVKSSGVLQLEGSINQIG